jgi:hypothetical protein
MPARQSAAAGQGAAARQELTAAQIVEKNVAARGGLEAWRKVQTMVWIGHVVSEHAPVPSMGFVLEQQRPNKTRFQLVAGNARTERVFDGVHGWRLRPGRDARPDVQPYTFDDLRFAQGAPGIDGPLIDYAAKGSSVTLDGVEQIDGHKAYRLTVRLSTGELDQVWIDAGNFLDLRYDRPAGGRGGDAHVVSLFYRGYRAIDGLLIPAVIETTASVGAPPDRMTIERTIVNAPLTAQTFAKPGAPHVPSRAATNAGTPPAADTPQPPSSAVPETAPAAQGTGPSTP